MKFLQHDGLVRGFGYFLHNARLTRLVTRLKRSEPDQLLELRGHSNALLVELFHELADEMELGALLECGAREATASVRFVGARPDRRAIAIEANPYTFEKMTRLAAQDGVEVVNAGVSNEPGSLVMRILQTGDKTGQTKGRSSFLAGRHDASTAFEEVRCSVTTVDRLVDDLNVATPMALWIDVEGMAHEVIAGAVLTLASLARLVFVEVETKPLWEGQRLFTEVCASLARQGLRPVARDAQLKNTQINVIFASSISDELRRSIRAYRRAVMSLSRKANVQAVFDRPPLGA